MRKLSAPNRDGLLGYCRRASRLYYLQKNNTLGNYQSKGASGAVVRRKFCKNCGSPILSIIDLVPDLAFIKAGTLNDKSWLKPTSHIWCSDAQPWIEIDEKLTRHDQNPT